MSDAIAFIGLGNPGAKYAGNRHNVGFMAVEALANEARAAAPQQKFSGLLQTAEYQGKKLYFFYPQTFMNRSGIPASELVRFFKIPVEQVVVFHDELDLAFGKLKIKQGGGHGGHNGLKSLDAHIGQNYWRVRVGIGHPGIKEMVNSHVLSDFDKDEQGEVAELLESLSKQLKHFVNMDFNTITNDLALQKKA